MGAGYTNYMHVRSFERPVICGPEGYDGKTPEQIVMGMDRQMVPRDVINILPQIRTEFEPEAMQELADSIPVREIKDGTAYYNLLNSPTMADLSEEEARKYIAEFNAVNDDAGHYEFENLVPYDTHLGERYIITIAGERRLRAGPIKVQQDWGEDVPIVYDCAVARGITYLEALPLQFIENNARRRPSRVDEANAISKYMAAQRKLNSKFSKAACARAFGVPPSRVDDAEIFTGYPQCMQELEQDFGFRTTVDAKPVFDLWTLYHQNKLSDTERVGGDYLLAASDGATFFDSVEELAAYETRTSLLEVKASSLYHKRNPDSDVKRVTLDSTKRGLEVMVSQDNLFGDYGTDIIHAVAGLAPEADDIGAIARRRLVSEGLYNQTIEALRLLDSIGGLYDVRKMKIAQFTALHIPADENGSPIDLYEDSLFAD